VSIGGALLASGWLFWIVATILGIAGTSGHIPARRRTVYFNLGWTAFGLGVGALLAAAWTEALT
jgi:hypothetical protein